MKLNDEQMEAVACDGHLSLVSCPGSGKTRTIVAKILRCLEDVRGTTRRIGCITYTNTAVNEIEHRLRRLGSRDDDLYYEISTIHSFCLNHVLRTNHHLLAEFRNGFEIITPDDIRWQELVKRLIRKHSIDGRRSDGFERIERSSDGAIDAPSEIGKAAAAEFIDFMDRNSLVTFSDMVYHSVRLVAQMPSIARGLASRYAWLLIDEFQDTTVAQVRLFRAIADFKRTKFFLVGDPNQSIMSFAGGHPGLMSEFAGSLGADQSVNLKGNYRCSKRIVTHAERLCPSDPPMQALGECAEFYAQPEWIHVKSITEAVFDHFIPAVESMGIPLGEAAVLAPWWITLLGLAKELRLKGVPMIGPGSRPYRRTRDLAQLAEHACAYIEQPDPVISHGAQRALFLMLLNINGTTDWRVYSYEGRKTLFRLLGIAKEARQINEGAASWLRFVAQAFSDRLIRDEFLPADKGNVLVDSANCMIEDMVRNKVDVPNFTITDLGLFAQPSRCLNMLTMHSAKGREFDAVAIVDLHDGKVPDFRSTSDEEKAEARRLLYVGVTRSRKVLMYFTDSSDRRNRPSPLLGSDGLRLG
jgi:DNA helicase-2/ATP-dependent DNA helicase PcrA